MSRNRSKSADTHHMPDKCFYNDAVQTLLIERLGLLTDLQSLKESNLSHLIYDTQKRLLTNKVALSRILNENDIVTLIETPNEFLNIALYLKHHTPDTLRLNVLQYYINMYQSPN